VNVAVIGAGSWGTALAKLCAEAGHAVTVWAYEQEVAEAINGKGENPLYLPGIPLPAVHATQDLESSLCKRDIIMSVVPSHLLRQVWRLAAKLVTGSPVIVSATKGIENDTLASMTEVLQDVMPRRLHPRLAVLSGPSFAVEVAKRQPTAVLVAAKDVEVAHFVQATLATDYFRIYASEDVAGAEIGGAAKNVVAIAVGMSDGLGFGGNTRAALITRGLAEIARLAVAKGANPLTLAGLSGMGDLVLTCTGDLSRNRRVGLQLGRGRSLAQIEAEMKMVAEGIHNAKSCRDLAARLGVEMPVTEMVHDVLYEGMEPGMGARRLMGRAQKDEL